MECAFRPPVSIYSSFNISDFTLGTASVLSVVGVTLYRLTMSTILSGLDTSDLITDNAVLIASATSVLINFACVQILNELFGRCAKTRDPQKQT